MKRASSRSHVERMACPLYTAIAVIDGRWKPMLYQRLSEAPLGFNELRRRIPGVAPKVLREQLRQMMADDLIARTQLTPRRLGVRLAVTPYGRSLAPVMETMWKWGSLHLARRVDAHGTRAMPPRSAI